MPKFTAGDEVEIDGQKWIVRSWPADDVGPFFATRDHDGAQVQGTFYAGQVRDDIDETAPAYEASATGNTVSIPNTAGDVPAVDDAEKAESAAKVGELEQQLAAALAAIAELQAARLSDSGNDEVPSSTESAEKPKAKSWTTVKAERAAKPEKQTDNADAAGGDGSASD